MPRTISAQRAEMQCCNAWSHIPPSRVALTFSPITTQKPSFDSPPPLRRISCHSFPYCLLLPQSSYLAYSRSKWYYWITRSLTPYFYNISRHSLTQFSEDQLILPANHLTGIVPPRLDVQLVENPLKILHSCSLPIVRVRLLVSSWQPSRRRALLCAV